MEKVKQHAPACMLDAEVLLRDQFVDKFVGAGNYQSDSSLRHELKQLVRRQPNSTLLDVRAEAIRWEWEGSPSGMRGRSHSVPSVFGVQYGVQGSSQAVSLPPVSEMGELREMLRRQQEQLNQLTESIARLQNPPPHSRPPRTGPIICRRCNQPGHFARECDGVRVTRSQPPSNHGRQSRSALVSEN